MKKTIVQKVVVGGILKYKNKVLILQRATDDDAYPGLWEVPSGKKGEFENVETALKREFLEESGIIVEVYKPLSVFNYKTEKPMETRDVTQINFLVEASDLVEVRLSPEHQNYDWIGKGEIEKHNLSKEVKKAILLSFET